MSFLMHQNMRIFGGQTAPRVVAYQNAFATVLANQNAVGQLAVAGFTEITNNGAAVIALGGLCNGLGLNFHAAVACGRTALARGGPEFVGIGVSGQWQVLSLGRILMEVYNSDVRLIHDIAPAGLVQQGIWAANVPNDATLDYRGLVYVVVQNGNTRTAVGFLHNLYTFDGNRTLVMGKIGAMMALLQQDPTMQNLPQGTQTTRYIGGDFNVAPMQIVRKDRATNTKAYPYSIALQNVPMGANPGGTTWGGNLYDYWYSDIVPGAAVPTPIVDGTTMDTGLGVANLMSDHAAILLRIP